MSSVCFGCEYYLAEIEIEGEFIPPYSCNQPNLKILAEESNNAAVLIEGILFSLSEQNSCPFWKRKKQEEKPKLIVGQLSGMTMGSTAKQEVQIVLSLPRDFDIVELEKALLQGLSSLKKPDLKRQVEAALRPFAFDESYHSYKYIWVPIKKGPVKEGVTLTYEMEKPLDKPTDFGRTVYPETDGYYEGSPCTCEETCKPLCSGTCGCVACKNAYSDFLSLE